jgi:hypothetical protein
MRTITKTLGMVGLAILISLCVNTTVNAQSPADDPGIGGPGSPGNGPSGDGGPIVPFDGGMSLMLVASGIAFCYVRVYGIRQRPSSLI